MSEVWKRSSRKLAHIGIVWEAQQAILQTIVSKKEKELDNVGIETYSISL